MLKTGDLIGDWVVDRALGQGGMGSVYRCHNREAPRILAAVKVLDASLQRQEHAKLRFVREAEILYQLEHPNIVRVRNIRMITETPHIEMEFVQGEDLESRMIRAGGIPWERGVPLFKQVADAVAYLHERGVCHRDIKPANLLLQDNGNVKLVDFGIALESGANPLTQQGMTFGSLGYVPPEWMDEKLDHVKWDLYSMGVLFYELLTGLQRWQVQSGGAQEMVRILADKAKTPYLDPGDGYPTRLRALVADMTLADRGRRLSSAAEVRARLDAIGEPAPSPDASPPPPRKDARPRDGVVVSARLPEAGRSSGGPARVAIPTPPPREPSVVPTRSDERAPSYRALREASVPPPSDIRMREPYRVSGPTPSDIRSGSGQPYRRPEALVTDPAYRIRESRHGVILDVAWTSSEIFAEWSARQLENYTMFLAPGQEPLPTAGTIRVLIWHQAADGTIEIDCPARVQTASPLGVSFRLELEPLQQDRLHRWRTAWERGRR